MTKKVALCLALFLLVGLVLAVLFSLGWFQPNSSNPEPSERFVMSESTESQKLEDEAETATPTGEADPAAASAVNAGPWSISGRVLRQDAGTPGLVGSAPDVTACNGFHEAQGLSKTFGQFVKLVGQR